MKKPTNTPLQSGLKKAGTTVVSTNSTTKNLKAPILTKGNPGNGLWCINTESTKKAGVDDLSTYTGIKSTYGNPNLDIESEFEKKIIDHLKFQVNDLNKKLIVALQKADGADYNLQKALTVKDEYIAKYEEIKAEALEQREKIDTLENTVMSVNEALNNAKKEINRLINENRVECEKSKNYYEMYQSLMLEKERRENSLTQEINALKGKIQQERHEKENIFKTIKDNTGNKPFDSVDPKDLREKELQLKINENNVNKLFNENCEIRKKLTAEEAKSSKLNELVRKKKEKLKGLKDELKSYKDAMVSYTSDVKWNQDLVLQRDSQIKVLKEKIKKMEEEMKKMSEKVKSKKPNASVDIKQPPVDEDIVPVKSRPFLFGPEGPDY
jgi:chromosome segregation ATPase